LGEHFERKGKHTKKKRGIKKGPNGNRHGEKSPVLKKKKHLAHKFFDGGKRMKGDEGNVGEGSSDFEKIKERERGMRRSVRNNLTDIFEIPLRFTAWMEDHGGKLRGGGAGR